MKRILATALFRTLLFGRCPACASWTTFSPPTSVLTGHVPAELQGLVPQICKCQKNGCTSSVPWPERRSQDRRAITSLELRTATVEA